MRVFGKKEVSEVPKEEQKAIETKQEEKTVVVERVISLELINEKLNYIISKIDE